MLLGGFLLINPFLVALAPDYFAGHRPRLGRAGLSVDSRLQRAASFWFPLGFTYEVLRRARTGRGMQLPDWQLDRLGAFAHEGAVKLVLAIFTLLLPAAIWMGACYGSSCAVLGLPPDLLSLFVPPIMLLVIPFCGVACCRWLDGASVLDCALNYAENLRLFRQRLAGLPASPRLSSSA